MPCKTSRHLLYLLLWTFIPSSFYFHQCQKSQSSNFRGHFYILINCSLGRIYTGLRRIFQIYLCSMAQIQLDSLTDAILTESVAPEFRQTTEAVFEAILTENRRLKGSNTSSIPLFQRDALRLVIFRGRKGPEASNCMTSQARHVAILDTFLCDESDSSWASNGLM